MKRDERKRKRHRTSRRQKVEWLRERPWAHAMQPIIIAKLMIESGLYSPNTRQIDVGVRRLLEEVRG